MSKKHFELLADALANTRPDKQNFDMMDKNEASVYLDTRAQWERDVRAISDVCLKSNKSFDYQRFVEACKNRRFIGGS